MLGLILWPISIEIIGFLSPFWAHFHLGDSTGASDYLLLSRFQPYMPLISILFSYAFYLLSMTSDKLYVKIICVLLAILLIATSVYGFLEKGTLSYVIVSSMNYIIRLLMLCLGVKLLLNHFSKDRDSMSSTG
ncbi:hypothetical protein HNR48_002185 [Pseudoteredinibacter isoporae]|uniref:Uncharacterized protein n=1 Tax=Pseudoteredinibacter isoporae TaxID=570281 RepID=A0A7X0JTC8_9GAMM|nr:hypothetical protein [Pseudoteredinibacter isoporae]